MRRRVRTSVLISSLLVMCPVGTCVEMHAQASGQKLNTEGQAELQRIIDSAHHPDLRWTDFPPYKAEVKDFYPHTGSTLGWIRDRKPTPQAQAMIGLSCNRTTKDWYRRTMTHHAGRHGYRNCKDRRTIQTQPISMQR